MCYKVWSDDGLLALRSVPETHLPAAGSGPGPHPVSDHQQGDSKASVALSFSPILIDSQAFQAELRNNLTI